MDGLRFVDEGEEDPGEIIAGAKSFKEGFVVDGRKSNDVGDGDVAVLFGAEDGVRRNPQDLVVVEEIEASNGLPGKRPKDVGSTKEGRQANEADDPGVRGDGTCWID